MSCLNNIIPHHDGVVLVGQYLGLSYTYLFNFAYIQKHYLTDDSKVKYTNLSQMREVVIPWWFYCDMDLD